VLHRAFPHRGSRRRGEVHQELTTMRLLRNRIGHHEPIHHRHLEADHATLFRVLSYLSTEMAAEAALLDQVPDVLKSRQDAVGGLRPPRF
jgi:hypothetical protein